MLRNVRVVALGVLGAAAMSGCATKGYVNRTLASAMNEERSVRATADSAQMRDIGALRTDLQSLRTDLNTLRTEFGARITAMEDNIKFTMPVHFAYDDASVRTEDRAALERFAKVVGKYYPGSKVTIEGFADPAGTKSYNAQLSKRRASAVKDFLVAQGLNDGLLSPIGYGESRQVRPGASRNDPGAELNRRVVFVVEAPGASAGIAMAQ